MADPLTTGLSEAEKILQAIEEVGILSARRFTGTNAVRSVASRYLALRMAWRLVKGPSGMG